MPSGKSREDMVSRDTWYRNVILPDKIEDICRLYKIKQKRFSHYTSNEIEFLLSLDSPEAYQSYKRENGNTK